MKTLFGIIGLLLGAGLADFEGAVTGFVLGLLTGAHINSLRRISALENQILHPLQTAQPATEEASPPVFEADSAQGETPSAESGWNAPAFSREEMLPSEYIVPAVSTDHRRSPEPSDTSPDPESVAGSGRSVTSGLTPTAASPTGDGLFVTIERAVTGFFTRGNIVVKVGVIILFFGVSFLLKYAAQRGVFPVELRLAGIAAIGIGLLLFGWRLRARKRQYALVIQGGAVGILYLTVFAATRLYQVLPAGFVFVLMVAMVVFSCMLAVIQNARALAVFATVGGFLAPVLTSTGQGSHVALFSYYALLNAGILGIAWFKAWRSLNWFGFIFTFVIASFWGARYYQPEYFSSTEPFLILFFLFYVAIPVLYAHRQPPQLKGLVDGTLVFGVPLVGFALQSAMVRDYAFGQAWSALALAALYLGLARTLWFRQVPGMRMLTEAFLALAVIFVSLAVPLAMDGHWTAAAWSLEGAGITWVSLRQRRLAGRIFGLLLQVGAGFAFLAAIDLPHGYTPVFNSAFLGSIMISIAGLFTGYQYYVCRDSLRKEERDIDSVLLVWGLVWWFGAGIAELQQHVTGGYLPQVILIHIAASAAVLFLAGRRVHWPATAWPPVLLLPVMVIFAGIQFVDRGLDHPFEKAGYIAWPVAVLVQGLLLRRAPSVWPVKVIELWHMVSLWLLMFLLSWFVTHVMTVHVPGMQNWNHVFQGVVPAVFVMLLLNFGSRLQWPVNAHASAYLGSGLFPVIVYLGLWVVWLAGQENDPAPLTWIPVVNPHDIAILFVFFNIFNWCWSLRQQIIPAVSGVRADRLFLILTGLVFVWLNSLLAHGVHFYAEVPWRLSALLGSEIFQAGISILWTLVALGMMVTATRSHWRRLWLAGAILLGVTLIKLFVVDLADSGTVTRIVSFLSVGGLMLVIGYFSPVPPRSERQG